MIQFIHQISQESNFEIGKHRLKSIWSFKAKFRSVNSEDHLKDVYVFLNGQMVYNFMLRREIQISCQGRKPYTISTISSTLKQFLDIDTFLNSMKICQ